MSFSPEHRRKLSEARKDPSINWKAGSSKLKSLGISPETVKQQRDAGFRFCREHNSFLSSSSFLKYDDTYLCLLCKQDRTAHKKYGTPPGWYKHKFEEQNGTCFLCGNPPQGRMRTL